MLEQVWAGVYVTDNAVARVVAQLRRALGDTAREARFIETVPTRGYRFIAAVTPRVPAPVEATAGPLTPRAGETRDTRVTAAPRPHPGWAAALALLALAAFALAWKAQDTEGERSVTAPERTQITSSRTLDAFPAWSPDGLSLAYASDRSGSFEIFVRDLAAGGDRLALTSDGHHNVQPAWSPDGATLAYHSVGRGGIWTMPRGGGPARQVSRFGSRPAWSPDGTRLAFQGAPYTEPSAAAFETFGPSSVWVVHAAGGEPRRVTAGWRPEGSHTRPTWFPDGRRLIFASQDVSHTRLWMVDADSGSLTLVLDGGTRLLDPTLTPDGRALYYVRLGEHFELWRLPLSRSGQPDGTPGQVLPPGELDIRHVTVHPTDGRLAYVALATVSGLRSLPLNRAGLPAGPAVRLAEEPIRSARRPAISPDATRVAFERQSAGRPPAVWLLDLSGGAARTLVGQGRAATDPAWSSDGREVFFETGTGEAHALRAVDVQTGATRHVAALRDGATALLRPRLSPDGTRLAYTRSIDAQLEVWVRTLADGRSWRVARLGDGVAFPIWSPDGRSLAVDVWHDGHAQVHVVDTAGGTPTQVSRGVEQAWVRSWSPDGTRVAFAATREGRWNVWWARRDGTRRVRLTDYRGEHHYVRNPAWSPRGDRMVYEYASFTGNVWTVQLP